MSNDSESKHKEETKPPIEPKVLTVEFAKKRSEYNDGILQTVENVAMHQDEIEVLPKVF
jgi:hypothetical protein